MPIITGIFQFKGSMGGITADKNGVVRTTPKPRQVTAERTKENNREFGTASKQAKVIRSALEALQIQNRLMPKLVKKIREAIALDSTNERGKRVMSREGAGIVLNGFQIGKTNVESIANIVSFIENNKLKVARVGGGNITKVDFKIPEGGTDVEVASLVAKININPEVLQVLDIKTRLSTEQNGVITLEELDIASDPNPDIITVGAIGVRFFQEVNGLLYPLNNSFYDVGKVVNVI